MLHGSGEDILRAGYMHHGLAEELARLRHFQLRLGQLITGLGQVIISLVHRLQRLRKRFNP